MTTQDAMDYVGGYTVGNDVSARKLQIDPKLAGSMPQFGFSKGFDTFLPLGPCLVSSELVSDPSVLHLKTKVNGELRQDESLSDLLFDCAYLISYLSQGTTLQKGSIIMTGTPGGKFTITSESHTVTDVVVLQGIGHGMNPPEYLQPGDVVDVSVSGIGTLRNGVAFE